MKRGILAVVAVFATFVILDYIIHNIILMSTYQATAHLWRSQEEMILWVMYLSTLVFSIIFVYIYARFFAKKRTGTGVFYGLLMGLAMGTFMGIGSFSVMPIPCNMALTWFLGCIVEMALAGLWLGLIIKEKEAG